MDGERVHAVIGGGMSSISAIAQSTFALANIPQVAYSSSSVTLSDRIKYPTFNRVIPIDDEQSKALVAICKEFNWSYVAVVSTQEVYGRGLAASFRDGLRQNGGSVVLDRSFETFSSSRRNASIAESVEAVIRSGARIVALFVDSMQSAREFLETASVNGLMATYLACDTWINVPHLDGGNTLLNLNYVGVVPATPRRGAAYDSFVLHWKAAPTVDHPELACLGECRETPTWAGLPLLLCQTIVFDKLPRFCGAERGIPLDGSQPSNLTSRVIPGLWQKVDAGRNTTAAIELRNSFSNLLKVQNDDCRRVVVNVLSKDEPQTVLSRFSDGFLSGPSETTARDHCAIVLTAPQEGGAYFLQIYVNDSPLSRERSAGLSVNGSPEEESMPLTSIAIVLACVSLFLLCIFFALCFQRARNSGPCVAENGGRELLALFCNPRMNAVEARQYGIRPLALGQELKHLLRLMPSRLIAIEPAATLLDAQNACEQYSPRILSFSGHTFAGMLAFEDDNGRLDKHADPEKFAKLITGQLATEDQSTTPPVRKSKSRRFSLLPRGRLPSEFTGWRPMMGENDLEEETRHAKALWQ
ncbi:MAG: hypothetical protein SGPRY_014812, partial [Prymnesium sp.]